MQLTFRTKLMAIAGSAGVAFVILIIAQTILARRMEGQLDRIQGQLIPLLELGPRFESGFDRLKRSFQDSVAAQDKDALEKTRAVRDSLLEGLSSTPPIVGKNRIQELSQNIEAYSDSAYQVSQRLIAGETGVALLTGMSVMQTRQASVERMIRDSFVLDRTDLVEAFSAVETSQRTAGRLLLAISISCLLLVSSLSLILSRSVLRAVEALAKGLKRFGQGKFDEPILVTSGDELAALAQEANRMADHTVNLLKELESFSYSVAHDLRAPLRGILGFSKIVLEDHGETLPDEGKRTLERVIVSGKKMGQLIDGLLGLSRLARAEVKKDSVNLSTLAAEALADLKNGQPDRAVELRVQPQVIARGDTALLRIVLTNLLGNAWKFTSKTPKAWIQFGTEQHKDGKIFFVRDNGAGFDMEHAAKLFGTFQRLHSEAEFEGTGIGLATVRTVVRRHGGDIWAEGKLDQGATFFFFLEGRNQSRTQINDKGDK